MGATHHEQEFAQVNGVKIKHWAKPVRIVAEAGQLAAVEFEYTELGEQNKLGGTGQRFTLQADMLFKAIGQIFQPDPLKNGAQEPLALKSGRIVVDKDRKTSLPNVYAGGDCVLGGSDLTVQAVQDGKLAAEAIDRQLRR
jgi:glutamate synthase (NADPH/NADH) small chain